MKEFTFIACCDCGGDGETYITVELTDEEAEKLVYYGTKYDVYYDGFNSCDELEELYSKVYKIAIDQITEELIDSGMLDEEDEEYDEDWRADDTYYCVVNFPAEFEDMLVDEE